MWYAIAIGLFVVIVLLLAYCLCRMARMADDNMDEMERAMRITKHKGFLSDLAKWKSVKENMK